jgi:rubrerythrin
MDHEAQRVVAEYLRRRRRIRIVRAMVVVSCCALSAFRTYLDRHDVGETILWSVMAAAVALIVMTGLATWRGWRCPLCNHWLRGYRDPEACPACDAPFRFTTHRR